MCFFSTALSNYYVITTLLEGLNSGTDIDLLVLTSYGIKQNTQWLQVLFLNRYDDYVEETEKRKFDHSKLKSTVTSLGW